MIYIWIKNDFSLTIFQVYRVRRRAGSYEVPAQSELQI